MLLLSSLIVMKKENLLLSLISLIMYMYLINSNSVVTSKLCIDKISYLIIMLTLILSVLMMSMFMENISFALSYLILILIFSFMSNSIILFYIFFELSIAPIFLIIFYKGKQYERLKASMYILIYTLLASFPFLFFILSMNNSTMTWSLGELIMNNSYSFLLVMSYLAFLTKLPVFFLHLWLPKAHVEAPIYGSMILAGVMLKLGTFGLIKFVMMTYVSKPVFMEFSVIFIYFSIISGLMCVFSNDLKVLIAFSSVSHMTFLVSSMNVMHIESSNALLINAISHGFISSNLFFVLNMMYSRMKSRSIFLSKSCSLMMNFWILLLMMSNFSAPPFISFFSEIMLLMNYLSFSEYLFFFSVLYLMMTTLYSLYVFYCVKTNICYYVSKTFEVMEWKVMILLIFLSFLSITSLNSFMTI